MQLTAARLTANRANARLSTGPKTEAGKAQVARNRYAHGLAAGNFLLMPWEDASAFAKLVAELRTEHQPSTPTEVILVNRMSEHHWLRGRALVLQEYCFNPDLPHCFDTAQLALFLRYQTTHERAFGRCLAELQKLKKTRSETEVGFEPRKRSEPEPDTVQVASAPANPLQPQTRTHHNQELPPVPGFAFAMHQNLPAALMPPPRPPGFCLLTPDF